MLPVRGVAVRFAATVQFTVPVMFPVPAGPVDTVIQEGESVPKANGHKNGLDINVSVPLPPAAATVGIGFGEKTQAHCCAASGAASAANSNAANGNEGLIHTIVAPGGRGLLHRDGHSDAAAGPSGFREKRYVPSA
jgi:hypothetical protein